MMFGWCNDGKHDQCIREYERMYIDPKGKIVYTGEIRKCQCIKRGCKCFVSKADRAKTNKRRRKS